MRQHLWLLALLTGLAAPGIAPATDNPGVFGSQGLDGRPGLPGHDGLDGAPQTVFATGRPQTIVTRGSDGSSGGNGENGSPAEDCVIPRHPDRDLVGARGGHGGDGGDGGIGGDGGNVTIHYRRPGDLRRITIDSSPGRGAPGGYGGRGAPGCLCPDPHIERRVCIDRTDKKTKKTVTECRTVSYRCEDGAHGHDGRNGQPGRDGLPGKLTLIPRMRPLRPAIERRVIDIRDITRRTWTLSRNRWVERDGALALLAPGSVVADEYRLFAGRTTVRHRFRWRAKRPLAGFSGRVRLELVGNDSIAHFPPDIWLARSIKRRAGTTTETITHAIRRDEALRLAFALKTTKKNGRPIVVITETAPTPAGVTTGLRIRIDGARLFGWKRLYEGAIPPHALQRTDNGWRIAIDQLPLKKKYLQPGRRIRIRVQVTRGYHGNNATLRFKKRHDFPDDEEDEDDF